MNDTDFQNSVRTILNNQTPRVWSLIVTIFGDLAQNKGNRLSGATVNAIIATFGIKPEAARVALHRLRKEGWIESFRQGRETSYGLTQEGRRQSAAASPRIYTFEPVQGPAWLQVRQPGKSAEWPASAYPITPSTAIIMEAQDSSRYLSLPIDLERPIPDWMAGTLLPANLQDACVNLADLLAKLQDENVVSEALAPLQIAVLRVLIVHEWRRVALRAPQLPDHIAPAGWRGAECRSIVAELLGQLKKPNIEELEQAVSLNRS